MLTATTLTLFAALFAVSQIETVSAASEEMRIMGCPVNDSVSFEECRPITYAGRLIFNFVPPIIMALGTLIFIPFFYCARYCCNCCGGSKQTSNGYCCAGSEHARYSWGEILRAKIYAVIVFILAVIALSYSMSAGATGRDGLVDLFQSFKKVPTVLRDEMKRIDNELVVTTYDADTDTESTVRLLESFNSVNETMESVVKDTDDAVTEATEAYNGTIESIMTTILVVALIPAILMMLNLVWALANIRRFGPMLTGLLILIFLVALWLCHGAVSTVAMLGGDVCAEIEGLGNQQRNVIDALIPCPDSLLEDVRKEFSDMEKQEAKAACDQMEKLCIRTFVNPQFTNEVADGRVFNCPGGSLNCSSNTTFSDLLDITESMTMAPQVDALPAAAKEGNVCSSGASTCTIAKCSTECTSNDGSLSTTGKRSKQAYFGFLAAAKVADVFAFLGSRFHQCSLLLQLAVGPMIEPCSKIQQGLFDGRMSTGLEAVFCVIAVFVCSFGSKRYLPFNEAGMIQDEDLAKEEAEMSQIKDSKAGGKSVTENA